LHSTRPVAAEVEDVKQRMSKKMRKSCRKVTAIVHSYENLLLGCLSEWF